MKDRLVTPGYVLILVANFLLYFAFYLILPVLPFYLTEVFQTGNAAVGVILSCYTVASLCIRPFSGYLLDTLDSYTTKYDGLINSLQECYDVVRTNRAELEVPVDDDGQYIPQDGLDDL